MAGNKNGMQLCALVYCCPRRKIPEPGFWLLYQNPLQPEIQSHKTGLQTFWAILYCPAQQPTGLTQVTTREPLPQEVANGPGSFFNH